MLNAKDTVILRHPWCFCSFQFNWHNRSPTTTCLQGAEATLQALARALGKDLLQKLPRLWEHASASIATDAATATPEYLSPPTAEPQVRVLGHECFAQPCLFCLMNVPQNISLIELLSIKRAPQSPGSHYGSPMNTMLGRATATQYFMETLQIDVGCIV